MPSENYNIKQTTNAIKSGSIYPRCYKHPNYKGLRKPRTSCKICEAIHFVRVQLNIKELRKM